MIVLFSIFPFLTSPSGYEIYFSFRAHRIAYLQSPWIQCPSDSCYYKKSLKISKGQSEDVVKRKRTINYIQTLQTIEQHEPHLKAGDGLGCFGRVRNSCSISDTRRVKDFFECDCITVWFYLHFQSVLNTTRMCNKG
jgi:hypothetical protein